MSEVPLVRMLTTGGTIATARDPLSATTRPVLTADDVRRLAGDRIAVAIRSTEVLRLPSWSIGVDQMLTIARAVGEATREEGVSGVVVTHGTTTLEYTAFLSELLVDTPIPVVFTGAMRRADDPRADGPENVRGAIRASVAPELHGHGVLICFAGQLLAARTAWKRDRGATDAFEDLAGPIGRFSDGHLTILRKPDPRRLVFADRVESRVALVKAYPGADGTAIEALVAGGAVGVVVEALPGVGGVPPLMQPAVREAVAAGIAVVIASRAPVGRVPDPPNGGTGEPLRGLPLVSAGDLTAEKAWLLLSVALGQSRDVGSVRETFRTLTSEYARESDDE